MTYDNAFSQRGFKEFFKCQPHHLLRKNKCFIALDTLLYVLLL